MNRTWEARQCKHSDNAGGGGGRSLGSLGPDFAHFLEPFEPPAPPPPKKKHRSNAEKFGAQILGKRIPTLSRGRFPSSNHTAAFVARQTYLAMTYLEAQVSFPRPLDRRWPKGIM